MLLLLMKDSNNKEYINELIIIKQFLFIYNSMSNVDLSSIYDINKFMPSCSIILSSLFKLLNVKRFKS